MQSQRVTLGRAGVDLLLSNDHAFGENGRGTRPRVGRGAAGFTAAGRGGEPEGAKRVHIHVREQGRFNQRYALLFRDYLRADEAARRAYGEAKQRAAKIFPNNVDGYLFIKEPVMDLIFQAAERWAAEAGWK